MKLRLSAPIENDGWHAPSQFGVALMLAILAFTACLQARADQPAGAASDTTNPVLTALNFPASVDATAADGTLNIDFSATDDLSGVTLFNITFLAPASAGSAGNDIFFAPATNVSGSIGVTFPRFSQPGPWTISTVDVRDATGNNQHYAASDLAALGFPDHVEVVATPDSTPPVLTALSFGSPLVDTSAGAGALTVNYGVSDDLSGATLFYISFVAPSGSITAVNNVFFGPAAAHSGSLDVTFPQFSEAGTWAVQSVMVRDAVGNNRYYAAADLAALGLPDHVEVASVSDTTPPVLTAFSFSPTSIHTAGGPATVNIAFSETDDISGATLIDVRFHAPSASVETGNDIFFPASSSLSNTMAVTFPQFSETGIWNVESVNVRDNAGNQRHYSTADLVAAGFPTQLTVSGEDSGPPVTTPGFHGVGDLPGGIFYSEVRDATSHSGVIYAVGGVTTRPGSPLQDTAFLWTSTGGMVSLPDVVANPAATSAVMASAISADGSVIASRARNSATANIRVAVRVTNGGTANQALGFIPGDNTYSAATAISADGSIVYGFSRFPGGAMQAFRWTATGGLQPLGFLSPGDNYSIPAARATSTDGSVLVGTSATDEGSANIIGPGNRAYRYVQGSGMTALPFLDGGTWNEGLAVTADGNIALGIGDSGAWPGGELVAWNNATGATMSLGSPDPALNPGTFGGITADGMAAVLSFGDDFGDTAYLRNQQGWFPFQTVLTASGLDLTGWNISEVLGVSSDGTLVFGRAMHNGNNEGWVAQMPAGYLAAFVAAIAPPVFTAPPQDTSVSSGQNVTLNIGASGAGPFTYQWQKDGVNIPGATAASLTLANVTPGDAGVYRVVVTNQGGSVTSAPATVAVNTPPAITTQPIGFTATVHTSGSLTVATSGLPAPTYQWNKDGVAIPGATSATLNFANLQINDAGNYDVTVSNAAGSVTSDAVPVVVNQLGQTIIFNSPGSQAYGSPPVTLNATASSGLPVSFNLVSGPATIVGNLVTLTGVGIVTVRATQGGDATYATAPAVEQSFTITPLLPPVVPVALINHAPTLNGAVEGTVQQLLGESVTLNGGASVTGNLLVPGTPTVKLNGSPIYGGAADGTGSTTPSGYTVTLNGGSSLGHLVRRTNPVAMPTVAAPPSPTGTRAVTINSASQGIGPWTTLRDLTLNGNVGSVAVPAGIYGNFTANGGSGLILGVAGATQPSTYYFQNLVLNGNSSFQVAGPVIVVVAHGVNANSRVGSSAHPEWLVFKLSSGGLTLNGNVSFYGFVTAPAGPVTVNGGGLLTGGVAADRLILNGSGRLRLVAPDGP